MRIRATAVACGVFLALCGSVARSDTDECRDALDHYNSAKSDVSSALRHYRQCVSDSKGHDDCSFGILDVAFRPGRFRIRGVGISR